MHCLAVVGAGIMGKRICRHFLGAGHPVALIDPSADALDDARTFFASTGHTPVLAHAADDLDDDWRSAALVIEAVPEVLDLKRRVIADLERFFAPTTVIASNSSGLRTAQLVEGVQRPERFLIAHFFNPADVIPAVEIVPASQTRPEAVDLVADVLKRSGKKAAILRADVPGFIANRLQHALMRECFHLLETGVADAETIDLVTRYSLGVRLAAIGPFLQRDCNGLDTHLNVARYLYSDLDARHSVPDILERKVKAGELGRKTGQGFYAWDAAKRAEMDRIDAVLPQIIAISASIDEAEGG